MQNKPLKTIAAWRICFATMACFACATSVAVESPGKIIDLSHWKLTLPIDTPHAGNPDEVVAPNLANFSAAGFFQASDDGAGVVFRAPCGGATTSGSSYPRCELREMQPGGKKEASWSTSDALIHSLRASLTITQLPAVKPHVVCAQIHDADDDLLMIRLEGKKLQIERNKEDTILLNRNYQLGASLDLRIDAGNGHIRVFYNGEQRLDWPVARSGCYFKAGCYTQSNTKKGDAAEACGEVLIKKLELTNRLP